MSDDGRKLLAVTSSTAVVGVAAAIDGTIVASDQVVTDRRHAEELTPMIARVLADAGWAVGDLSILAVDVGPGRFTGLRVGLATVRTLALAIDAPVVGMTSLEILAADHAGPVTAVVDARRNEVFQQRFVDGDAIGDARVGPAAEMVTFVEPGDTVIGDGADRYRDVYGGHTLMAGRDPLATSLARIAAGRSGRPGREVEPVYLRDADVQINIKTRHNS